MRGKPTRNGRLRGVRTTDKCLFVSDTNALVDYRYMAQLAIRTEIQNHPISDEVSALVEVVRPILEGLLYTLKSDVVREVGGTLG